MKDRQSSDKANQGRSGGVNNQTGTLNAEIAYAASTTRNICLSFEV